MPRPKPPEPYVNIALRLPPPLADKVRGFAASHGFTVSGAIRHMIKFHEEVPHEEVGRIMKKLAEPISEAEIRTDNSVQPMPRIADIQIGPVTPTPGSRLKKPKGGK